MAKKEDSKIKKFIVRTNSGDLPVCGLRYNPDKNEILIGGPKSKMEKVWEILGILDSKQYGKNLPEDDDKYKIDGSRFRIKVNTSPQHWNEFSTRLGHLYRLEPVKHFKRLMG